ncbi:hypothetical protein JXM67_01200 [candidate division WOR-3 bacterium]|nr:hypothetical protein [candidate division WOR-3 bacterium]
MKDYNLGEKMDNAKLEEIAKEYPALAKAVEKGLKMAEEQADEHGNVHVDKAIITVTLSIIVQVACDLNKRLKALEEKGK